MWQNSNLHRNAEYWTAQLAAVAMIVVAGSVAVIACVGDAGAAVVVDVIVADYRYST